MHATRTHLRAVAAALALLAAGLAHAGNDPVTGQRIPRQIPYRGVLERAGAPVAGTSLPMTFRLYDAAAGGTLLWSETQPAVAVQNGRFSVALGEVVPIPSALFAQADLFLEVSVAGSDLQGRQRLYSVPYAHHAAASSATPAGTMVAFAGPPARAPAGWLPCDGRLLAVADHPALFAAIAYDYGGGGESFALPDLRGRFLRGGDAGTGRDPGPRGAGQVQDWATGMARSAFGASVTNVDHSHGYGDWWDYGEGCGVEGSQRYIPTSSEVQSYWGRCDSSRTTAPSTGVSHAHAIAGGDAETRPANVTATWIIRVLD